MKTLPNSCVKHSALLLLLLLLGGNAFSQGTYNEAEVIIDLECETEVPLTIEQQTAARLKKIQRKVPLDYNDHVQNYINVYTLKKKVTTAKCLGRSKKYFPMFDEVFSKLGVPTELKYLAVVESALNPLAVSRKGATGIFQFMYSTAKMYDLSINKFVDERRDPYLSAEAAAKYLLNSYNKYGNWLHVIASYNCGAGNVDRAIKKSGGSTNFWDIYPYLPAETRGYVPAFIAAYYVMTYHKDLGIAPEFEEGLPAKMVRVPVEEKVTLSHLEDFLGLSSSDIKKHNPSLLTKNIPEGYFLTIPEELSMLFQQHSDSLYAMAKGKAKPQKAAGKDTLLAEKKPLKEKKSLVAEAEKKTKKDQKKVPEPVVEKKPEETPVEEDLYFPEDPDLVTLIYTVKAGDNIGFIAEWYHTNVSDIKKWNGLRNNALSIGQEILIYVSSKDFAEYERFDHLSRRIKNKISKRMKPEKAEPLAEKPAQKEKPQPEPVAPKMHIADLSGKRAAEGRMIGSTEAAQFVWHEVKQGDALWDIARRYNTTVKELQQLNKMGSSSALKPGTVLKVGRK